VDGVGTGDVAGAVALTVAFSIPLALTVWALLDAARRPEWAWALAGRRRVVWLAVLLFSAFTVVAGLATAAWYLARVRADVAAAERGEIGPAG
jgi:NhaP-type Na+/H+ or K+/H+ antiporter